ncbi:toxin-antitoxin system YwqK family antitoxin [Tenacibaculum tangerinum]|uniref:Toxin-antitoxin system YwqK family antitoxin n=1 Tax=Tenacibaculum tangerinum TaxID=3038772 RepID=A0ABY8L712_9FLAO|nr:toxin-antitoxin system YwqK family antitoxin [Tenacibaculum tangerinum]WGH76005.1 toxin-antitoxin system YwqK family antitoxin [Tenacibaculum tangerinum]
MIHIKSIFSIALLISIFFITATQAQKINQFDTNGNRHGVWKKYYDAAKNKIRYSGEFKNGKEIGTFNFYESNSFGIPSMTKEFSAKSDSAFVRFFTPKGKVKTKGWMIGKKRVGKWTYYFSDGTLFSEEEYVDGKLHGVLKNYYRNGKLTEESTYKDGKKNGLSKIFTETGIMIEEVHYVNGQLQGEGKYYDLKGDLKEKGMYKNGKRDGKWEFYMDGEVVTGKRKRTVHAVPKD